MIGLPVLYLPDLFRAYLRHLYSGELNASTLNTA